MRTAASDVRFRPGAAAPYWHWKDQAYGVLANSSRFVVTERLDATALESLIYECRARAEWGYGCILVRDVWINYMLKDRQKSEFDGLVA